MKTVDEIKKETLDLILFSDTIKDVKAKKKIANRVEFLNTCKLYMEHNPTKEFLKKEKLELEEKIKQIDTIFIMKYYEKPQKEALKNELDYKKLKLQLKTISYLLAP